MKNKQGKQKKYFWRLEKVLFVKIWQKLDKTKKLKIRN